MTKSLIEAGSPIAVEPTEANKSVPEISQLDVIIQQSRQGLGTIGLDDFRPPTEAELLVRVACKEALGKVRQRDFSGAAYSMASIPSGLKKLVAASLTLPVEVTEMPETTEAKGSTRMSWSWLQKLGILGARGLKMSDQMQAKATAAVVTSEDEFVMILHSRELFDEIYEPLLRESNEAYETALAYWEERMNTSPTQRDQDEYIANRDRIVEGRAAHEQALRQRAMAQVRRHIAVYGLPLQRLDTLMRADAQALAAKRVVCSKGRQTQGAYYPSAMESQGSEAPADQIATTALT